MSHAPSTVRQALSLLLASSFVVACAASNKRASEPASKTAASPQEPAGYGGQPATGDASKTSDQAPPPPPPAPQASQPPSGTYAEPPPNARGLALSKAHDEVESAQRELDVAAGDCRNACRALGSMDRAAGRLCGLAQSSDETRRCEDAKKKVYTARDRVKSTCGKCDDVTVDRNAPIPSRP